MGMLAPFGASFLFIALRAFQQLNVVHDNRRLVVPTSVGMAACEVFLITEIARQGFGPLVVVLGLGAGLGALAAMSAHRIIRNWKEEHAG